jgi:hypothetical protein
VSVHHRLSVSQEGQQNQHQTSYFNDQTLTQLAIQTYFSEQLSIGDSVGPGELTILTELNRGGLEVLQVGGVKGFRIN